MATYNSVTISQTTSASISNLGNGPKPYFIQTTLLVASGSTILSAEGGTPITVKTGSINFPEWACPHFATEGDAVRYLVNVGGTNFNALTLTAVDSAGKSGSLALT